jgi:hypothetical protein
VNSNTEVVITLVSAMELEDVLKKIGELKEKNPNTKFRVEVSW